MDLVDLASLYSIGSIIHRFVLSRCDYLESYSYNSVVLTNKLLTWLRVPLLKVLIIELATVDALSSSSVMFFIVPTLTHKPGDDTMEAAPFVAEAFFHGAESPEVFGCLWHHVIIQLEHRIAKTTKKIEPQIL